MTPRGHATGSAGPPARWLIVNADDFGMSPGVNAGVARAHEQGLVTSASLMVRRPFAAAAAGYARHHPRLAVGLHLDLGEWVYRDGEWQPAYHVVDNGDARAVDAEVRAQVAAFRALGLGEPTHLDSHQHVHRQEQVRGLVRALGRELDLPVRDLTPGIRYVGNFYGQWGTGEPLDDAISPQALIALVQGLSVGTTELGCHPGLDNDADSPYRAERSVEVATLCDARVRQALRDAGVMLRSFADLRERSTGEEVRP